MTRYQQFVEEVSKQGLMCRDCGNGHWQIIGGDRLVNFYPDTKKGSVFYISGTAHGRRGSLKEAINAAGKPKEKENTPQSSYLANVRKTLLKKPFCNSCGAKVDSETAILNYKIPIDKGGTSRQDNFRLLCPACVETPKPEPQSKPSFWRRILNFIYKR